MSLFAIYRSVTFALFIICNAILCSVAVWDITNVHTNRSLVNIDIYLVFVGALGLAVVFPILFIEIFRKNAIVSRAWFEVSWIALLAVMNLVGASVVSAIAPSDQCDFQAEELLYRDSPCISSRVVIAFAWLNTIFLLGYFFVFLVLIVLHQKEDDKIWHATTQDYPWFETKSSLNSAPNSPTVSRFSRKKPPSFAVPKPRRPAPTFIHGRAGLDPRVEIGHLQDNEISPISESHRDMNANPIMSSVATQANANNTAAAFYSHSVQTTYASSASVQTQTQTRNHAGYHNVYSTTRPGASPPPLGDWPQTLGAGGSSRKAGRRRGHEQQRTDPDLHLIAERERGLSRSASSSSSPSSPSLVRSRPPTPPPSHSKSQVHPPTSYRKSTRRTGVDQDPAVASSSASKASQPASLHAHKRAGSARSAHSGHSRSSSDSGSSVFTRPRPRPPPLDLTLHGAAPSASRRR